MKRRVITAPEAGRALYLNSLAQLMGVVVDGSCRTKDVKKDPAIRFKRGAR